MEESKMHWCQDETLAAMSTVPVVGVLFRKLHKWYHTSMHHKCHEAGCQAEHLIHMEVEQLLPNPPGRDVITVEDVDFRYGQLATILLMCDRNLLGTRDFPPLNQFVWMESGVGTLSARWNNRFFLWEDSNWKLDPEFHPTVVPPTREELFDNAISLLRQLVADAQVLHDLYSDSKSETIRNTEKFLESL